MTDENACTPVWCPEFDDDGDITEYPCFYDEDKDRAYGGDVSLDIGAEYYRQGMDWCADESKRTQTQCFKAAEFFYKKSAGFGNVQAMVNLGYVYSYGRCGKRDDKAAFECFEQAAEKDHAEACYKLGDLYSSGRGCGKNEAKAYELYKHAYELGKNDDACVWGSAAYRLACCAENARGCSLDMQAALGYYREAGVGFEQAIREGYGYYSKNLSNTRNAIKRLNQELAGGY